ncbi:MAG: hypothetical protein ACFFED_00440 [Candidatus Thorarchaeota archaeon]
MSCWECCVIVIYLMILGVFIGLLFYAYTRTLRSSARAAWETDPSTSGMVSGPINQTRASGEAPKVMPVNIRTGYEDNNHYS